MMSAVNSLSHNNVGASLQCLLHSSVFNENMSVSVGFLLLQHLVHDLLRADIVDVQLNNVQPPDEWKSAVASKQKAQQDIILAYNERDQAIAKVC